MHLTYIKKIISGSLKVTWFKSISLSMIRSAVEYLIDLKNNYKLFFRGRFNYTQVK